MLLIESGFVRYPQKVSRSISIPARKGAVGLTPTPGTNMNSQGAGEWERSNFRNQRRLRRLQRRIEQDPKDVPTAPPFPDKCFESPS